MQVELLGLKSNSMPNCCRINQKQIDITGLNQISKNTPVRYYSHHIDAVCIDWSTYSINNPTNEES